MTNNNDKPNNLDKPKKEFLPNNKKRHNSYKHGMSKTKIYFRWVKIIGRCTNKNDKRYKYYGARGIKVCKRWSGKNGFVNFYKDVGDPPLGMSIDRINNNGDYKPSNIRWTNQYIQNLNRGKIKNTICKYRGVYKSSKGETWFAVITFNNKRYKFCGFKTERDAAIAYNKSAKKIQGKYAMLNIIEDIK